MPKTILITHQKGGVGKSTITYNIANTLFQDAKIAICDLDNQGSLLKSKDYSNVPIYASNELERLTKSDIDFLFIDTPPYLSDKLSDLIKISDIIIIPTKVGFYDFLAISDTIELIKKENKDSQSLIVFNMVKPNTTLTAEMQDVISEYGINVSENYLSDLVAFTRSGMSGVPVNNKARKQIDDLTVEILTLLSK